MTEIMPITSERLLVAIGVAKRSHDVLVHWPAGRPSAPTNACTFGQEGPGFGASSRPSWSRG